MISWTGAPRAIWSRLGAYAAGGVTVLAGILAFLGVRGDLRGFFHWGVAYTFGPYAKLRHPNAVQSEHLMGILARPAMKPTMVLCLVGVLAFAILVAVSALRIARASSQPAAAAEDGWRAAQLVLLVCLVGLTIHLQGKTHCGYHFIPLKWALSLLGAALAGRPLPWGGGASPARWPGLRAALGHASFVAGIALFAAQEHPVATPGAWASRRRFADQLGGVLAPGEEVVIFGFVPSILCDLQRPTPLPFVDSWIMYVGAPEGSVFRREYVARWEQALADPRVRFYVVQTGVQLVPGQRFDPRRSELSEAVARERFPPGRLAELGYAVSDVLAGSSAGFIVYERARR